MVVDELLALEVDLGHALMLWVELPIRSGDKRLWSKLCLPHWMVSAQWLIYGHVRIVSPCGCGCKFRERDSLEIKKGG